jgi:hypothetical protein
MGPPRIRQPMSALPYIGRAAGAKVPTMGAGEQIDGVNGERTQHELRACILRPG